MVACLFGVTQSAPAAADSQYNQGIDYIWPGRPPGTGDCTGQWTYLYHDPYLQATTYAAQFSDRNVPCGAWRYTGANQLLVHPITFKNGDGHGGYESMYNWGVFRSACCYAAWSVTWNYWLSDYWGPGWYTLDQASQSYIRQCDCYGGGWRTAVIGHWMPS